MRNKIRIALCVLCSILFLACGKEEKQEKIRAVKVEIIGQESRQEKILEYPGVLLSENETKLSFSVSGKIDKILVEEGSMVQKGEVLAILEKENYFLNAEGNLQKYLASQASADNAQAQFERVKTLYENNAIAKKDFDMAQAQYKAAIAAAKGNSATFAHAQKQLEDTELRAPYSGYISNKFMDNASVVSAGTPILSLSSGKVSKVTIQVASKELKAIEAGKNFVFFSDDEEKKQYSLRLKHIGNAPNLSKMTYPVSFELVEGTGEEVRSGMTGVVRFSLTREAQKEIVIPMTALFEENGSYVYLFEEGKVVKRKVEIGELQENGKVSIQKGLSLGERLIVAGISNLYEGQKVKLLSEESVSNVGKLL